ncbi:hypothetical protein FEE96_16475 [Parasedimentitalea maritima]|uniref:Uncharacterized protein n=1 Tax=Parasedimentitalea maritima TaxID=2578117 RepID=A0A5R8Z4C8_9RHOB|nr:hypothetical protein [Zongyanglinia marina]KAE9631526.1 hypothetical protein GP644_04190 [Zongyanglinia marina]TLP60451.1 hypothetical protein FEE96_16475 [Zongyanglinia marina]
MANPVVIALTDEHIELLISDRTRFNQIVKPLSKGWDKGEASRFETNSLGFEYFPKVDEVAVYVTFNDGSDEVRMSRADFLKELRKHTDGDAKC